jgi:spore maturation protein CgeB
MPRNLVVFGLSISSSWGNGHAPTFRGLLRALADLGWSITFFEQDVEWYRSNRDLPHPEFCDLRFYADADWPNAEPDVRAADAILVGSLVANGQAIIDWLAAFDRPLFYYDIDTPLTLEALQRNGAAAYLRADQIPIFQTYFSFAGGPALEELQHVWRARHAEALFCGVDTTVHRPVPADPRFECALGYMGTYAPDRQPALEALLLAPARARPHERFLIAGAQYPPMDLPPNVRHEVHVYPRDHAAFYCSNFATLNLNREAMRRYGWAPSTRLFEAAACGACIVSDTWPGLDEILEPEREVLVARTCDDVLHILDTLSSERRDAIGRAARRRVMADHTYEKRAAQVDAALHRALSLRATEATP